MTPFSAALGAIASAFTKLEVAYLIGGTLASSARGVLRATIDVDVLAPFSERNVQAFVEALGPSWYADAEMIRSSIRAGRSFNVIHRPSGQKFDIFPAITEFRASELARATAVPLDESGAAFPIATAEDILVAKLEWYKAGGGVSERHWADILGILAANANLDLAYARRWAEPLGIGALLTRAIEQAG